MTELSDILEIVEKSLFEALRGVTVEHGYLPDIEDFIDNDNTNNVGQTTAYELAQKAITDSPKKFCIEVFGASSPRKKYEKRVPRIVLLPKRYTPGNIGGTPNPEYQLAEDGLTYNKLRPAARTTDYNFEISLVSNSAKQDRILHAILALAIPSRGYIKFIDDATQHFFVEQYSFRESPDTEDGINEKIYMFRVTDIYLVNSILLQTDIAPINSIQVDVIKEEIDIVDEVFNYTDEGGGIGEDAIGIDFEVAPDEDNPGIGESAIGDNFTVE